MPLTNPPCTTAQGGVVSGASSKCDGARVDCECNRYVESVDKCYELLKESEFSLERNFANLLNRRNEESCEKPVNFLELFFENQGRTSTIQRTGRTTTVQQT